MERSLLWSAFALGWAGWLCAALLPRSRRSEAQPGREIPRVIWAAALALPIIVFLATLPDKAPFAEGQGWGRGFVIGALCSLLAAWSVDQNSVSRTPFAAASLVAAPFFLALPAVATPLLWMWGTVVDALMGVAIGWLCISLVLGIGYWVLGVRLETRPETQTSTLPDIALAGSAFTATLCAAAGLGVFRGPTAFEHHNWSTLAVVLGAGVPFALLITALPTAIFTGLASKLPFSPMAVRVGSRLFPGIQDEQLMAGLWRLLLGGALVLGLAKLLSFKLVEQPPVWISTLVGLLAALTAWWLLASENRETGKRGNGEMGTASTTQIHPLINPNSLLALLVIAAAVMAVFTMMAGYGLGLALIGGWIVVGLALTNRPREDGTAFPTAGPALTNLLVFGGIVLLSRLFFTRFMDDLKGVGLTDQYALFGLILGTSLPGLTAAVLSRTIGTRTWQTLVGLVLSGLVLLAAPALTILLWGAKCALAMLFGLALSCGLGIQSFRNSQAQATGNPEPSTFNMQPLFALAAALAITQWTHLALPLASFTRTQKVYTVAGVVVALLLVIQIADYAGRIRRTSGSLEVER